MTTVEARRYPLFLSDFILVVSLILRRTSPRRKWQIALAHRRDDRRCAAFPVPAGSGEDGKDVLSHVFYQVTTGTARTCRGPLTIASTPEMYSCDRKPVLVGRSSSLGAASVSLCAMVLDKLPIPYVNLHQRSHRRNTIITIYSTRQRIYQQLYQNDQDVVKRSSLRVPQSARRNATGRVHIRVARVQKQQASCEKLSSSIEVTSATTPPPPVVADGARFPCGGAKGCGRVSVTRSAARSRERRNRSMLQCSEVGS